VCDARFPVVIRRLPELVGILPRPCGRAGSGGFPEPGHARAQDGVRAVQRYDGSVVIEHRILSDDLARRETPEAWEAWLARVFAS
jgi:hypothetical protein